MGKKERKRRKQGKKPTRRAPPIEKAARKGLNENKNSPVHRGFGSVRINDVQKVLELDSGRPKELRLQDEDIQAEAVLHALIE